MEFPFNVSYALPGRITVIESKDASSSLHISDLESDHDFIHEVENWTYTLSSNAPWDIKIKKKKEELENVIDTLGLASAQAQNLHSPITALKKLVNSSKQKIYTMRDVSEPRCVIGMLKVGIKRLFVSDDVGAHHEVDPLCVLDFYVHESKQRCGFGHELFGAMLKAEGIEAVKLAIDRPSYKCLAFLQKHYNLNKPIQQNNNFVIYPGFLQDRPVLERSSSSKKNNMNNNILGSDDSLHSVPMSLSSKEIKSKIFYSSPGNFLSDCGSNQEYYRRKKISDTSIYSCRKSLSPNFGKDVKSWGVREAMHSHPCANETSDNWNNFSCNRSLTPVNNVQFSTPKKWDQLQSSWNVLGVKPLDYSPLEKSA